MKFNIDLIVEDNEGIQHHLKVGEGGDDIRAKIFDSRIHGELTSEVLNDLGGLIRNGNLLTVDLNKKNNHLRKIQEKQMEKQNKENEKVALREKFRNGTASNDEIQNFLSKLI